MQDKLRLSGVTSHESLMHHNGCARTEILR